MHMSYCMRNILTLLSYKSYEYVSQPTYDSYEIKNNNILDFLQSRNLLLLCSYEHSSNSLQAEKECDRKKNALEPPAILSAGGMHTFIS